VPQAVPIELLIHALCEPDLPARTHAAKEIFRLGHELAEPAVKQWLIDAGMMQIFALDDAGFPIVTVGLAVQPATFERIRTANGSPPLADVPPDQDAREFELHFSGSVRLDVLTTREPGGAGAIARFLGKLGEGIQQVELSVHDVDRATEILLKSFGIPAVYPATREGADATRINFFLVRASQEKKVLIELVEPSHGDKP
jgi:hypothetical protein